MLLFLAPLCGPAAIVLLPLFALRALIDRDLGRLMQLAPLAAGAAVQLLLFYGSSQMRSHLFDPMTVAAAMFVRLVALPMVGVDGANRIGAALYDSQLAGGLGWWLAAADSIFLFCTLMAVAAKRRDAAVWLVLSALSIAAVSLGMGTVTSDRFSRSSLFRVLDGERYNFLPLVLLGLALVLLSTRPVFRKRYICVTLCVLVLITGAYSYPNPLSGFAQGPVWPAEVAAWRTDHQHPLAVWPRPWTADLSDESRSCSPGRHDSGLSQPRYCESGWAAGFLNPETVAIP
jgi:hypothetical protein